MNDQVSRLYDHLVVNFAIADDVKDVDLNAPSTEDGSEIAEEKAAIIERERAAAAALAQPFGDGLTRAWALHREGIEDMPLDDRDPAQNAVADALIRYLVSFDLAESRTEETDPLHYVYHVSVAWDRLAEVAAQAGVDLDAALAPKS